MRSVKVFKASLLAASAISLAGLASAQSTADLEARIAALEAMVGELKGELAATKAATDQNIVRVEKRVEESVGAMGGAVNISGFKVGDATLSFGGFIDADFHVTHLSDGQIASTSIARDFYIPGATPIGGEDATFTDFTAEASRFFLKGTQDVGGKKVTGYFELDFLGSAQGNELVSNSYSPRLRRAYIDIDGKLLIGQEWTTFQNLSAIPESASFLALPDGMVFVRQAQLRYTSGNWQFAIENPNTTSFNFGNVDDNVLPDFIARYNYKGDFGNVSIAGIARQLRADFGATEEEVFGWGLSAAGQIKVGAKDDIRFNITGGEGLGRYIGLAASRDTALDTNGDLEAITSYGGLVAWRHPFGDTARFNVGYSGLFIDNPDYLGGGVTKQVQSAFGAVLWDIAPKVTVGTEILYGVRELENGADGEIARFTFSTKYSF